MVRNKDTKAKKLIEIIPKEHPVSKLYSEIEKIESKKLLIILEKIKDKFANYRNKNIDFNEIKEEKEV